MFGAILLDSDTGLDACRASIYRFFADRMAQLSPADELKDPKTRLQEYLQSRKLELPAYDVLEVSGKAHDQYFVVECRVAGIAEVARGEGRSRRRAEQTRRPGDAGAARKRGLMQP